MEPPTAPWTNIAMDFVTQLLVLRDPVTNYTYNSIFVVVDRFTKAAKFVPFQHSYTAEQLARVFLDRIVRHHGIPKLIISNRDKLFTLNY